MRKLFNFGRQEAIEGGAPVRAASNPGPLVFWGLLVVVVTFGGFGIWAAWVPLARGAHVTGQIVVDSSRKTIQHLEGGIVKDIRIQEGSRVRQGDVLLVLDETQVLANLKIVTNRHLQERVQEARLVAERDWQKRIAWPKEIESHREDEQIRSAVADQQSIFDARRREVDGQVRAMSERAVHLRRQSAALARKMEAYREQIALMGTELAANRELEQKGFATSSRVREIEREWARLRSELAAGEAQIAEVEASIQAAELDMIQTRQAFIRQVVADLQASRARLEESAQQLTASSSIQSRTTITAPVDGQVIGLAVHTVGGVVQGGQPIMEIVPENDRLIIEARVRPVDADVVHTGLPAEIRLSSLPPRQSPLLKGRVISVSSDTLSDFTTKETYYLARIEVREGEMAKLRAITVVPGMPVEVLISAGERTLLDYLVAPVQALFERAMRED